MPVTSRCHKSSLARSVQQAIGWLCYSQSLRLLCLSLSHQDDMFCYDKAISWILPMASRDVIHKLRGSARGDGVQQAGIGVREAQCACGARACDPAGRGQAPRLARHGHAALSRRGHCPSGGHMPRCARHGHTQLSCGPTDCRQQGSSFRTVPRGLRPCRATARGQYVNF